MNPEAQKRAPIYEALERFRKKRVVPVVAANRVGEEWVMEDRLSWGLFRFASAQPNDVPQLTEFYEGFLQALKADHIECEHPDLLLFTIIELVGSTGYSCIVYESPCDLKTYLPWLHQSIHQILIGYAENPKTEDAVIPRSESDNPVPDWPDDCGAPAYFHGSADRKVSRQSEDRHLHKRF